MNSSQPAICTIASTNYLAYLRTVCQSFLEHHPLGSCHVLFIDEFSGKFDPASEPFRAYGTEEMGVPELQAMSFHYDAFEFSCSLKPYFARHLLQHHGLETLFYLDADTWVTGSFQAAQSQLAECDALLTPHLDEPLPMDGLKPNDADMVLSGAYNMGFLGLRNTPNTIRLLDWWAEQLVADCIIDHRNGLLGDQRFMDQAIQTFPDIQPFSNIAYNVAYWNLHSRAVEQSDGEWQVNGAPMAMFHFSGYSPDRPKQISRFQNRFELESSAPLTKLFDSYLSCLRRNGLDETRQWPYGHSVYSDGGVISAGERRLFRKTFRGICDFDPFKRTNHSMAFRIRALPHRLKHWLRNHALVRRLYWFAHDHKYRVRAL